MFTATYSKSDVYEINIFNKLQEAQCIFITHV